MKNSDYREITNEEFASSAECAELLKLISKNKKYRTLFKKSKLALSAITMILPDLFSEWAKASHLTIEFRGKTYLPDDTREET